MTEIKVTMGEYLWGSRQKYLSNFLKTNYRFVSFLFHIADWTRNSLDGQNKGKSNSKNRNTIWKFLLIGHAYAWHAYNILYLKNCFFFFLIHLNENMRLLGYILIYIGVCIVPLPVIEFEGIKSIVRRFLEVVCFRG